MSLDKRLSEIRQTTYAIDTVLSRARDLAEFVQAGDLEGATQRKLVKQKAAELLAVLAEGSGGTKR